MDLLVHDVVEEILEKLPPKSLMRFKSVSKQWKSTIESRVFQHKHLIHNRQKSKTPHLLMINIDYKVNLPTPILESIITLKLESSIPRNIPIPWENNLFRICENSIDGLVCLYNDYDSVAIFNPTTRWYRTLPPSTFQQQRERRSGRQLNAFGFGKDEINGLYKPVWLYNSLELNSDNHTTCEVFDFNINAWRFIQPSSPKRIIHGYNNPVYLNGLLYWLTEEKDEEEILSVLSLDLTTETFEIVCKAPFKETILFNLNDNLCRLDHRGDIAVIWWLNFEEKKWNKLYNMDLLKICTFFQECYCEIWPVALMGENNKLMLYNYYSCCAYKKHQLMIYDRETTSSHEVFTGGFRARPICYFQSLISIL